LSVHLVMLWQFAMRLCTSAHLMPSPQQGRRQLLRTWCSYVLVHTSPPHAQHSTGTNCCAPGVAQAARRVLVHVNPLEAGRTQGAQLAHLLRQQVLW